MKTTGKPIKWIICFSTELSKVFFDKRASLKMIVFNKMRYKTRIPFKNHKICRKFKNRFLGSVGSKGVIPPVTKNWV